MNLKPSNVPCNRFLVWFIFALSLGVLLQYLYFAPYGLDFTDEGFYLNWFKYPYSYPAVATFFGYIYAFPYKFLGENLIALRVFNLLTILGAAAWCAAQPFERMKGFDRLVGGPFTKVVFVFSLSTLSLLCLEISSTPNYNHLAFIGCLLVTGALIKSGPLDESPQIFIPSFGLPLISGIVAASLAKPTTGFALGLVCLTYAFFIGSRSRLRIILCLALSLVLTVCISIFLVGSPSELISRVTLGKQWASLLGGGHDLRGLANSVFKLFFPLHLPLLMLPSWALFVQASIVIALLSPKTWYGLISKLILIIFSLIISWYTFFHDRQLFPISFLSIGSIWFSVFPLSLLLSLALSKSLALIDDWPSTSCKIFPQLSRLFLILLIPFAYPFATNTNLWTKILSASLIFVCVASTFIVQLPSRVAKRVFTAFLLMVLIGDLLLLPAYARFYRNPYRQPQSLVFNKTPTQIGPTSQLILSEDFSQYITDAKIAFHSNGFKPGSPILDLSGQSPGLIYAVNGRAIALPWMIGGYKGSDALASAAIAKVPCNDLYSAWLIVEPDGPRSIDISILNDFGIDIYDQSKYQKVAHLVTPKGAGGYDFERHQFIYRPLLEAGHHLTCTSLN